LDENESVAVAVTRIIVRFDQDLFNPNASDPDSVTNPANFRLISDNGDGFQTTTCSTNVSPLDTGIPVTSVTYSNNGGLGPFIATVHLGASLQNGAYRLIVCGTTSITDLNGLTLAGDGTNANTDFNRNFTVLLPVVQTTGSTLPATGFPMGKVTTILPQPASLAYSSTDLWLEIPKLGVKMPIVGVPQTKNGWEVTWLNRDAGWLNGSAFPTWKGNSVLTAHVWDALNKPGPFAKLKELKYGDQVKVHAFGQVYVYEIRENATVLPRSLKTVFKHEEDSWITLITCEDYSESTKTYSYRRMVRATLVSVTPEN
jgi:LPXTG-site transpeptidase (sortase) family protein